ncbi:menaquinone-dependent protoporphyrinogen IX oxidase [Hydrogenispora ethanolica]|jgi:menaquinone-dependent protoporphyrinogen IX oxidase|uniref:Menaquinone-dependent protoporphyrinogen IX oxidase n=1 Tax=Hydrogenispora ethanolica TaxID=1082276 RepID=A0A4R1R9A4_HYDET|nr:flavodoxin domain-containing protein [Hydrogenispora ethanolica]TCL62283.1 menaquinone-dependent protoporphyrinogen IX oxidase [Hydrogenispora ethanolica]
MKTLVIYRSKSGFARQYAEWIAADLQADLYEAAQVTPALWESYDTVIYGAGLYAVGINGIKLIKENLDKLRGKKVIVFATGASPARDAVSDEVRAKNFTPEQQQRIRFFYLRGGFNYHKLQPCDKVVMSLMKWSLKRKKQLTLDDQGLLAAYDQPVDFTDRRNIADLVAYAKAAQPL